MGPTLIFDKSTLESLNPNEAVWLDQFFIANITPLFYIETLADLEKQVKSGRTPEAVVGSLASKTPDAHSTFNAYHKSLLASELVAGAHIDVSSGRATIARGQTVTLGGSTGTVVKESPEEEAFRRWQRREFLDIERAQAKEWRRHLQEFSGESVYEAFQAWFPNWKPKSLTELKERIDRFVEESNQEGVLRLGLSLIGFVSEAQARILSRWIDLGSPPLTGCAPYFVHVCKVDLLFALGIACDLIGRERSSNRVDMAYLYYLPFCQVFSSNDTLHATLVTLFLNAGQTFVPGRYLTRGLAELDIHFRGYRPEVKSQGIAIFADYPPHDNRFLVTRLWDKYMSPKWRENLYTGMPDQTEPATRELVEKINRIARAQPSADADSPQGSDDQDFLLVERLVMKKKGKWRRYPPELADEDDAKPGTKDTLP